MGGEQRHHVGLVVSDEDPNVDVGRVGNHVALPIEACARRGILTCLDRIRQIPRHTKRVANKLDPSVRTCTTSRDVSR